MPYQRPDGSWSRHPITREAAAETNAPRYDDGEYCPTCDARDQIVPGHRCSIKYTRSGRCAHCASLDALAFYNAMVLSDKPAPPLTEPTDDMREAARQIPEPFGIYEPTPVTAAQAVTKKAPAYVTPDPCDKAGHLGLRTLRGYCWGCERDARQASLHSPRQQAIAAGELWYTPDTPCPRCGTTALRRVNNGACQGCQQPAADSATASLMKSCPDLVMSRDDARTAGMTVYRTGKPCKREHTGYRYVSTGGCIECLRP